MWEWSTHDDLDWKDGWLICPIEYTEKGERRIREIKEEPPNNCPYKLEHILSNEE